MAKRKHDGWAVKGPDGKWFINLYATRKEAIIVTRYVEGGIWKDLYRQGYRCVKVRLVEVQDAK